MSDKGWYISPLGWLELTSSNNRLTRIRLASQPSTYKKEGLSQVIMDAQAQLEEYFLGLRRSFDLDLDFGDAPEFYKAVWEELQKIPYGKTVSYSYIAKRLNNPKAVRAVGRAAGANPFFIVVPCHRVLGKRGDLTGFFYGLDVKRELLSIENPKSFGLQRSLFDSGVE